MSKKEIAKKTKEPLFHITKRTNISFPRALLIRVIAIFAAVVLMSIILYLLTKKDPFTLLSAMFNGAFGDPLRIWVLFSDTAILLGIALALTPAFKMKFWNCGGEGQVLVGALVAAMMMFFVGDNEQSYRDYMVSKDKRAEDMEEWFDDIIEKSEYEEQNMKYVLMDKILGL